MKKENESSIVPGNKDGKSVDLEETVTTGDEKEAIKVYQRACERLMDPSRWHELAGTLSASFKRDGSNKELREKDYLMIDLPAPGNKSGEGHDWVQVETVGKDTETDAERSLGLRLRASVNPHQPREGTAHFFDEGATSSFIIKKKGTQVIASYHGRNEKPNTKDVAITDKIRNSLVAMGALAGFSELQWKALLKGFLEN